MRQVIVTINDSIPLAELETLRKTLCPVVGEGAVVDGRLAAALGVRFAIRSADVTPADVDVICARLRGGVPVPDLHVCTLCGHVDTQHLPAQGQSGKEHIGACTACACLVFVPPHQPETAP